MLLQPTGIEERYGMPHTPCYRSAGYRAWSVTLSAAGDCPRSNPYLVLLRVANHRVVHGLSGPSYHEGAFGGFGEVRYANYLCTVGYGIVRGASWLEEGGGVG